VAELRSSNFFWFAAKKKKTMTSKPKKVGLSVGELIVKAVAASKERNGLSVAALKKALAAGGYDVDKNKARVKTAIKSLVAKGTLVQTKGTRTSGSFKMNRATESKERCLSGSLPCTSTMKKFAYLRLACSVIILS
uniref:Histone H1 n=1 Tax=Maylandia zebra TaxID=106582 RepID=A0A3P9C4S6_9CICH